MKRWRKAKGIRVHPIEVRDAVAEENRKVLMELSRMTEEEKLRMVKKLQTLIRWTGL